MAGRMTLAEIRQNIQWLHREEFYLTRRITETQRELNGYRRRIEHGKTELADLQVLEAQEVKRQKRLELEKLRKKQEEEDVA